MKKTTVEIKELKLVGLDLGHKTTNKNGQSSIDGGNLWQKFEHGKFADKIRNKTGDEVYAVYYGYEGDHTEPFRYFIGCRVADHPEVPEDMQSLIIPEGTFKKITARGKMPDCMQNTWKDIWASNLERSYRFDFEVYDERSHDWSDAEIDIYLS